MKKIIALFSFAISIHAYAQEPVFTIGSERSISSLDNPEAITFRIENNNYILYSKFKMSEGMLLHLEGFSDPTDSYLCSEDIRVPHLPNEIAIYEGFVALNNKMVLFRSVYNKEEKKCVLYAHELNQKGMIIDNAGTAIASITAEKAMNSGNFIIKASSDGKSFVVLSEYPFVKETKEKFAVTVFDNSLKQIWNKEVELQYDSRRGPTNEPVLLNSGMIYVLKKVEGPKNADFYSTYQIADKGVKVKENVLEIEAPKKIVNYAYALDENTNDITIAGYYTEDGKVSVSFGGVNFKGTFISKITGNNGEVSIHTTMPFDKTQSTLRVINVLNLKGNTCLLGEERYENSVATEQKDEKGFPVYRKEFYADKIFVSVFDPTGKSISSTVISKNNKSIEDGGISNSFAAAVVGEQLMIVYNDYQYKNDGQEHKIVGPMLANVKIPVIQFIGADGSSGKKFALIDSNVGGKKGLVYLCPQIFIPVSNKEFFFLGKDSRFIYPLRMKLP